MRSGAAASRSRGSSSAAATSAASARRRSSSARARPRARRTRCMDAAWEAGITDLRHRRRVRRRPQRDATSAAGSARSADVREQIVLTTKTFNPMTRAPTAGSRPRGSAASSRRASSGSASTRVDLYLPHAMDPETPVAETIGAFDELVGARGRSAPTAAATSTRPGSRRRSRRPPASVQNSLLAARPRATRTACLAVVRARGARLHAVQPARRRLADRQVPPRRGRCRPGSRMTLRPEPYAHLQEDRGLRRARGVRASCGASAETTPAALAIAWLLAHPRRDRRRDRPAAARAPRPGARGARRSALAARARASWQACSRERARPLRADVRALLPMERVHRGDGRGAARARAGRAAPAAPAGRRSPEGADS